MSKTIEGLDAILEPVFELGYEHSEQDYIELKRQIEDFYRNKIPKDNTSMRGYATASLDELVGYSKCIDDITAQFNSKEEL